jgi:hypothetical protein
MVGLNEIIVFVILEYILINRINRYCVKNNFLFLNNVLIKQNLLIVALLFFTHIFSYYYYRTYPGVYPDEILYDAYAKALSKNLSTFNFSLPNKESFLQNINSVSILPFFDYTPSEVPFFSYANGGIIYALFGYSPIVLKFSNIILFQVSTIYFYKIIFTKNTISKSIFYIYAYNPVFFVYAISFLKESSILFCTTWFFYSFKINSKKNIVFSLIILFFLRPYLSPIYLLALIIATNKEKIKSLLLYSLLFLMIYICIDLFLTNIPYTKSLFLDSYQITDNSGKEISIRGIDKLFSIIISNPIAFIKYRIYYFTIAIFSPEIWVPKYIQYGIFAKNPYILSFDGLAKLLQAPLQLFILFKIFNNWIGFRNFIRENLIYIITFIILVAFNSVKSGVVRYQECITFFLLLIFANFNIKARLRKKRYAVLLILIITIFFLNDLIYRQRTIFNGKITYIRTYIDRSLERK